VEITEHIAIDDYTRLRGTINALGPTVRLAVDDAGAGYSSLRHILELAPDIVKLDIGLVRGIDADSARQALVAGIAGFAIKQNIRLVAEGIETVAELSTLRSLGVDHGQGYLLGRPRDARGPEEWPAWLDVEGLSDGPSDPRPIGRQTDRTRILAPLRAHEPPKVRIRSTLTLPSIPGRPQR
jgi:EAL domain-containing protein (putative c-di-GMP-specific phosphodiesterase class I)